MNILEEFWYGNLEPAEYDANTSKVFFVTHMSRRKIEFRFVLTDEILRSFFDNLEKASLLVAVRLSSDIFYIPDFLPSIYSYHA